MKIRVSRPRKEFGLEGHSFVERDAGESNVEIKITKTGYFTKKKVLEMGLQAANKMKVSIISIEYYHCVEILFSNLLQQNGKRHYTIRPSRFPGHYA